MKRNLNFKLLDLEGNPMKDQMRDPNSNEDAIARVIVARALAGIDERDRDTPAEKKAARGVLAMRVYNDLDGKEEYKQEEITQMKEFVGRAYGPLIISQIFDVLDKDPAASAPEEDLR